MPRDKSPFVSLNQSDADIAKAAERQSPAAITARSRRLRLWTGVVTMLAPLAYTFGFGYRQFTSEPSVYRLEPSSFDMRMNLDCRQSLLFPSVECPLRIDIAAEQKTDFKFILRNVEVTADKGNRIEAVSSEGIGGYAEYKASGREIAGIWVQWRGYYHVEFTPSIHIADSAVHTVTGEIELTDIYRVEGGERRAEGMGRHRYTFRVVLTPTLVLPGVYDPAGWVAREARERADREARDALELLGIPRK